MSDVDAPKPERKLLFAEVVPDQRAAMALLEELTATARPQAVFSSPVNAGEFTVITAAEVSLGLGFGFGGGGGSDDRANEGAGGGGGGGGGGGSRPVAVVEIGPAGVRVEPVMDVTKIVLAFITALGSSLVLGRRLRRDS